MISEALISPGPLASKISFLVPSDEHLSAKDFGGLSLEDYEIDNHTEPARNITKKYGSKFPIKIGETNNLKCYTKRFRGFSSLTISTSEPLEINYETDPWLISPRDNIITYVVELIILAKIVLNWLLFSE